MVRIHTFRFRLFSQDFLNLSHFLLGRIRSIHAFSVIFLEQVRISEVFMKVKQFFTRLG